MLKKIMIYFLGAMIFLMITVLVSTSITLILDEPAINQDVDEITLNVRVYLFAFESNSSYSSTFTQDMVRSDFEKVNEIWHQAGIRWQIESIENKTILASQLIGFTKDLNSMKKVLIDIAPPKKEKTWTVVYVNKLPLKGAGGFYASSVYTNYYTEISPKGPHYPSILAHELGHSLLGSKHSDVSGNLMSVGDPTDIDDLTDEQINIARTQAEIGPSCYWKNCN